MSRGLKSGTALRTMNPTALHWPADVAGQPSAAIGLAGSPDGQGPSDRTARSFDRTVESSDCIAQSANRAARPLNRTAQSSDRTARPLDRTVESSGCTARPLNRTVESFDRAARSLDRTEKPFSPNRWRSRPNHSVAELERPPSPDHGTIFTGVPTWTSR